jgi:hypothetical protein
MHCTLQNVLPLRGIYVKQSKMGENCRILLVPEDNSAL